VQYCGEAHVRKRVSGVGTKVEVRLTREEEIAKYTRMSVKRLSDTLERCHKCE
jgi:hypothetical protein